MFCTKNGRLLKFLLLAIKFNRLVKLKSARRCSVSPSFDAGHRAPWYAAPHDRQDTARLRAAPLASRGR